MPSSCSLRVILKLSLLFPLLIGLAQCRSNGIRHNHGRQRHISRSHEHDSSRYSQNQFNVIKPQDVRHVYHTYQKGSVRIPYHGATVRVPASYGPRKMYRGKITTTILDKMPPHRLRLQQKPAVTKHKIKEADWELSHDEPAKTTEIPCAKCPGDRAVIAKRGSITTIMERLPVIPCFPWSVVEDVKHEVMLGPKPGQILTEGAHSLVTRITHHDHPLATCHVMYNVIIRKCEPLEAEGLVKIYCPLGEAWGASCRYSCPDGYQLMGENSTTCNDHLEWSDSIPYCAATTSCTVPVSPENGHMTCRTPQQRPINSQNVLPDGTICHYWCSNGYRIPPSQMHLASVQCFAGQWNSTTDPTCIEINTLNETQNELLQHTSHHLLTAPRIGRKHCPRGTCHNGGKCFIILGEPLCLCENGFTGATCTEFVNENSLS